MDWFPLWNSLRIAAISSVLVFFTGIAAAYYAFRLPRMIKGVLDVVLTLPLVLPPTVVGYFLLLLFGTRRPLGMALESIGVKFVMTWYGGVIAAAVVAFPLLYRTARGAFEAFDETLGTDARPVEHLHLLAHPYARLSAGHLCGHRARVCACAGRIRRNQHANRIHPRAHCNHLDHGIPALAHGG